MRLILLVVLVFLVATDRAFLLAVIDKLVCLRLILWIENESTLLHKNIERGHLRSSATHAVDALSRRGLWCSMHFSPETLVDRVGLEPTTYRLRADYSAIELPVHELYKLPKL